MPLTFLPLFMTLMIAAPQGLEDRAAREVTELHQFFAQWFRAELTKDGPDFARFSTVPPRGFHIIPPSGNLIEKAPLLSGLKAAHGQWHADGSARIWIENLRTRSLAEGLILVTYEEWQTRDGETRGRISSAILQADAEAPNGLIWLSVHETWLASAEPAASPN